MLKRIGIAGMGWRFRWKGLFPCGDLHRGISGDVKNSRMRENYLPPPPSAVEAKGGAARLAPRQ
jgi:hypothetical protein